METFPPGLTKPGPWAFQPGLVAPEWQWVWQSCVLAFLMWDGGGGPVVYGKHAAVWGASILRGAVTWEPSARGMALAVPGGAADVGVESTGTPTGAEIGIDLATTGAQGSIFAVLERDSTTGDQAIFGSRFSPTNEGFMALIRAGDRLGMTLFGTANYSSSIDISPLTGPMNVGLAWEIDGFVDWYNNGSLLGTPTAIGSTASFNGAEPLGVWCWYDGAAGSDRVENALDGKGEALYVFDRKLSASRMAELAADPFGPFRMYEPFMAPVGFAEEVAAAGIRLRQLRGVGT